jgi:putative membrane protein
MQAHRRKIKKCNAGQVMMKQFIATSALMAFGLVTVLGNTAVAQTQRLPTQQNPTNQRTNQPSSSRLSNFDVQFIRRAAFGNNAEVQLSQLALERSDSEEVRQYAQQMIQDHTEANTRLSELAQREGIGELPTGLDAKHQAIREQLEQLSGSAFDREYMRVMHEDHIQTVSLFQSGTRQAQDQDVKAFASTTLPKLQGHLQMVRAMMGRDSAENPQPQR